MENNVRPASMERINTKALADAFIAEQVAEIHAYHKSLYPEYYN